MRGFVLLSEVADCPYNKARFIPAAGMGGRRISSPSCFAYQQHDNAKQSGSTLPDYEVYVWPHVPLPVTMSTNASAITLSVCSDGCKLSYHM